MKDNIKKLEEIYKKTRLDHFVMVISHLMDIGWSRAESITDEQIEKLEGSGFITKEFIVWLNKTARDIAKSCEPSALICFCMYHDIFDTKSYYKDAREKKIELAQEAIEALNDEYDIENSLSDRLADYLHNVKNKEDDT